MGSDRKPRKVQLKLVMKTAIVIGAGHGGLAVAARLQTKGIQVTVFEKSSNAVTIPQVLTLPAAYRDLFLKTGSELEENLELVEVTNALEISLQSGDSLKIPASGIGRVLTEIESKLRKSSAQQWREYILANGQLWLKARNLIVESEPINNYELFRKIGLKTIFEFFSYSKVAAKHLTNQDLLKLAKAYKSQAYVDSNSKLGLLGLTSYVQQTFGVYEPNGGLSALTNELENRCRKLGVQFEFGEQAEPVSIANQIVGVQNLAGRLLAADFVIVNDLLAEPQHVNWLNLPTSLTSIAGLYRIVERSWLGLGPAHAVLTAEFVAQQIGLTSPEFT